jgi:hypothetical protein
LRGSYKGAGAGWRVAIRCWAEKSWDVCKNSTTLQRTRCARTSIQLVVYWLSIQRNVLPYILLGQISNCANCTSSLITMRSSSLMAACVHFAIVRPANLDDVAVSPKPVLSCPFIYIFAIWPSPSLSPQRSSRVPSEIVLELCAHLCSVTGRLRRVARRLQCRGRGR